MKKLPFLTNERLSRLVVSLMLCLGLLLPLMFTFGASEAAVQAAVTAAMLCALFAVLGSFKRGRLMLTILLGVVAAVQLMLPRFGFFGSAGSYEHNLGIFVGFFDIFCQSCHR